MECPRGLEITNIMNLVQSPLGSRAKTLSPLCVSKERHAGSLSGFVSLLTMGPCQEAAGMRPCF